MGCNWACKSPSYSLPFPKWARSVTDETLDPAQIGEGSGAIDNEQTLTPKNPDETSATKKAAEAASSVTRAFEDTSESPEAMEPMRFELTTSCMPSSEPVDKDTPEAPQTPSNDTVTGDKQEVDPEDTESQSESQSDCK